ncbi:hypothetical protein AY601_1784 [Pedobacter cryoconitis]|uniref:Uncharacterized protein n=1 Tax=Pedobacter cryoconitis TaxID=188932 RepID=A0A127VBF7_9SPHI|nr:hypothetical protein AY601_1784 [Pedobacter cryoconitis]
MKIPLLSILLIYGIAAAGLRQELIGEYRNDSKSIGSYYIYQNQMGCILPL